MCLHAEWCGCASRGTVTDFPLDEGKKEKMQCVFWGITWRLVIFLSAIVGAFLIENKAVMTAVMAVGVRNVIRHIT